MIGEGSALPGGAPADIDPDDVDMEPSDLLSPEETAAAAAKRGLAVIPKRRIGKFKQLGDQIRDAGSLSVSRGMIAVGIDDCFRAHKEITKLIKSHGHDLDAVVKLLSLQKDFLAIRSKMSSDMASLGKAAASELSQEEKAQAVTRPILGDLGSLLKQGNQVTVSEKSVTVQQP